METSFEQPPESARCPTCGQPLDSHATICAACGTSLATADIPLPVSEAPSAPVERAPVPMPMPVPPQAASVDLADEPTQHMLPVAQAPASANRRRCEWCGAESPAEAERCGSCNAMFPRPEQDEAMRRAGEARIQAAEDEIALRQRARKWYGRSKHVNL